MDDLRRLVGDLMERVEALEAAQQPGDDAEGQADGHDAVGRGLRLFGRWRRGNPQRKDKGCG